MDVDPSRPSPMEFVVERPRFAIALAPPTVTRVLAGLLILVFVLEFVAGLWLFGTWTGPVDGRVLLVLGMKVNGRILAGEWWRLFTATLLHIGPFHLIANLIGLFMLGPLVEGHFGHLRFLAIYLVSGLAGSVTSFALSVYPSAGASGAIFGLLGATILYFYRYRDYFGEQGRQVLQSMVVVLVLNLVLGASLANVDNWGHLGGLVGGVLTAWGLLPRYRPPAQVRPGVNMLRRERRLLAETAWFLLSLALVAAGLVAGIARWR